MSNHGQPWVGLEVPEISPDEAFTQRLVLDEDRYPGSLNAPPVFNLDRGGFYHYPWQDTRTEQRSGSSYDDSDVS